MTPVSVIIRVFGAVEVRPVRIRQGTFRMSLRYPIHFCSKKVLVGKGKVR